MKQKKPPPPGLSGDLAKDKELVDKKVEEICLAVDMTPKEKVRVPAVVEGAWRKSQT